MMEEDIRHFFLKSVWSGLPQDRFYVISPSRLTSKGGAISQFPVVGYVLPLPDTKSRWHLFILGSFYTDTLHIPRGDIPLPMNKWVSIEDTINQKGVALKVYDQHGVQFPKDQVYHNYTNHGVLLLAVKQNNNVFSDIGIEKIYLKHYKSTYVEQKAISKKPIQNTITVTSTNDILALQNSYQAIPNYANITRCFKNGLMVDYFYLDSIKIGDHLGYEYEENIRERHHFNVDELHTFTSIKDQELKYLLTFDSEDIETTRYVDDLDVYVYYKDPTTSRKYGLYYHRNLFKNIRSVTHMSFSIRTDMVNNLRLKLEEILGIKIDNKNLFVELSIKNNLKQMKMVYEQHRMIDLHRLSLEDRIDVMINQNNLNDFWDAALLENSLTCQHMYDLKENITAEEAIAVLGYDTVSSLLNPSPLVTEVNGDFRYLNLETLASQSSTLYLFNNGKLVDYYYNQLDREYMTDKTVDTVEVVLGKGTNLTHHRLIYPNEVITIDSSYSYRVYTAPIKDGGISDFWVDVTEEDGYEILGNALSWKNQDDNIAILIKQDKNHYYQEFIETLDRGSIIIQLKEFYQDSNYTSKEEVMKVPYNQFVVWMNGYQLIEGLDYVINFPYVTISSKHYFNFEGDQEQKIIVRGIGLPVIIDDKLTHIPPEDVGFVNNGLISTNKYYNLRDSRNLSISVGGLYKRKDQVLFQEYDSPIEGNLAINGRPYSIGHVYTPMFNIVKQDTVSYIAETSEKRKKIQEYLTLKIPYVESNLNPIQQKHTLFSPFMGNLIFLILEGGFTIKEEDIASVQNMRNKVRFLEPWLENDLAYNSEWPDHMVQIHPHVYLNPITLDKLPYLFLTMVNQYYFNNRIKLTPLLKISNYTL